MQIRIKSNLTLVILAFVIGALFMTGGTSFAATQSVNATSSWRTYTSQEMEELHPIHDSPTDMIGNPSPAFSNPQNASNSSPGWTPDGATQTMPTVPSPYIPSDYASIILDLPAVDLSCSSDVKISVTGSADLLSTTSNNAYYGWIVVNNTNRPISYGNGYVNFEASDPSDATLGPRSLDANMSLNPISVSFGLKLIIGVQTNTNSGDPIAAWDVHDVEVSFSYDDEGGTCYSTNAPASVPCSDEYLNTEGVLVDQPGLDAIGQIEPSQDFINVEGDPNAALTDTGFTINGDLNESGPTDIFRVFELKYTPQSSLLGAGGVQLTLSYDIDLGPNDGQALIAIGDLANPQPWSSFNFALFDGTESVFLPASELPDAHIFMMVPTYRQPSEQYSLTFSNLSVTIRQLHDVAVCGISINNESVVTTAPVTTPVTTVPTGAGAVNGIGAATTLPETGRDNDLLLITATLLLSLGFVLVNRKTLKVIYVHHKK